MTEHITAWLGAYHDGELQGRRLRQVEAHLAHCATCRAQMEELRKLTALLQKSPAAKGLTPPERFVAQVGLRLPRRPEQTIWQRGLEIGWRLTPVGLLGAWAFVQAVFTVASVVLITLQIGLGGDVAVGLLSASRQGTRLTETFRLLGTDLNDAFRAMLPLLSTLSWSIALNLVPLVIVGLLYWSWLASWWAWRWHQARRNQA
jgi:predicted anti-sigma-YlaC factor YlaD